jgi:hypothetical protein
MTPTTAKRFSVVTTILAAVLLWWGLFETPPTISIPAQIAHQWDSIWSANFPQPCSVKSVICRPKEDLGCVQIERHVKRWQVVSWQPAINVIRLPMAASGVCKPPFNATWHTHPAVMLETDVPCSIGVLCPNQMSSNPLRLLFFRNLSGEDLSNLYESHIDAEIMTWAPKQLTAAVMWHGRLVYPVTTVIQ